MRDHFCFVEQVTAQNYSQILREKVVFDKTKNNKVPLPRE